MHHLSLIDHCRTQMNPIFKTPEAKLTSHAVQCNPQPSCHSHHWPLPTVETYQTLKLRQYPIGIGTGFQTCLGKNQSLNLFGLLFTTPAANHLRRDTPAITSARPLLVNNWRRYTLISAIRKFNCNPVFVVCMVGAASEPHLSTFKNDS
jgi:hypothetical protein